MTTTPIRALIVDDEPLARERMARFLTRAGCTIVDSLVNGLELLAWLQGPQAADVIFLDIQMPGPSGMDIVAEADRKPPVVFVTAYQEYAVRAFELAAVDYLLKPVFADRVQKCLERLRQRLSPVPQPEIPKPPQPKPALVAIRIEEGEIFLQMDKITHFEVEEERVYACHGSERYPTRMKALAEVEAAFPGEEFFRIQRHILLRPSAVRGLRPAGIGRIQVLVLHNTELPVSRAMTHRVRTRVRP